MTLAKIVEGVKAGFIKKEKGKDGVDDLQVRVEKTNPPREGQWGFTTLLTVSDGSGQDAKVFVDGEHAPALGSSVTLHNVRFYSYDEPAKEKGGGVWHNLGLSAKSLTADSASQPGPGAGPSRPGNGGGRDNDARIERQSARRDAVMLVASIDPLTELGQTVLDAKLGMMEVAYHAMLKLTGTEALPAPSQPSTGPSPEATGPSVFIEAKTAATILLRICGGDKAKAQIAFKHLTGVEHLAECKDKGMAEGWLTLARNIDAQFQKCAAEGKAEFIAVLVQPGLDPDARDNALETILMGQDIPF